MGVIAEFMEMFDRAFEMIEFMPYLALLFGACAAGSLITGALYLSPVGSRMMGKRQTRMSSRYDQNKLRVFLGAVMLLNAAPVAGMALSAWQREGTLFLLFLALMLLLAVFMIVYLLGAKRLRVDR